MRVLCAHCAWRRWEDVTDTVMARLDAVGVPSGHFLQLVTITTAHDPDRPEELEYAAIRSRIGLAMKLGRILWSRERHRGAVGMVRAVEQGQGANVHVHALLLGPAVDESGLTRALKNASSRAGDVDVRVVDMESDPGNTTPEQDSEALVARRIVAYLAKGKRADAFDDEAAPGLSRESKLMFAARFELAAHNRRLIDRYGCLRGDAEPTESQGPRYTEPREGEACSRCTTGAMTSITMPAAAYKAFSRARGKGIVPARRPPGERDGERFAYHEFSMLDFDHASSPAKVVKAALRRTREVAGSAKTSWLMSCMATHFASFAALTRGNEWRPAGYLERIQAWLGCRLFVMDAGGDILFGPTVMPPGWKPEGIDGSAPLVRRARPDGETTTRFRFGLAESTDPGCPHATFNDALDLAGWVTGDSDPARALELLAVVLLAFYEAASDLWADAPNGAEGADYDDRAQALERLNTARALILPALERVFDVNVIALSWDGNRLLYDVTGGQQGHAR